MTDPLVLNQNSLAALVKQIEQVGANFLKIETCVICFLMQGVGTVPPTHGDSLLGLTLSVRYFRHK